MSYHSHSCCWVHLIWGTYRRERMLEEKAATRVSRFLHEYARTNGIFMSINYVNADHVHALIDLPTNFSIEEVMRLLKGASSHWINENGLTRGKFAWGRGYAAFSVSHSSHASVTRYIADQKEHHRWRTFTEEYETLHRELGTYSTT